MASVSAEVLAIAMALFGAYLVYLRQQRDKYREDLVKDFQELDSLISEWSILEDYSHPMNWHPPISKYLEILAKESWEKSPLESLKDGLEQLDKEFAEAQKKEIDFRSKAEGRLVAGPALYLKMKFALRDLCQRLYAEFPRPPGDYEVSPPPGEIPLSVRSFVKYDFPNNREDFLIWTKRFDLFFQDILKVYTHSITLMISTLRKVHRESVEQTEKLIEELRERNGFSWHIEKLKESREYSMAEINYYDQVFQYIGKMKHKTDKSKTKSQPTITTFIEARGKRFFRW